MKFALQILKKFRYTFAMIAIGGYAILSFSFTDNYFQISKNLDIFASVLRELDLHYVDTISPGEMVKTGIDAMLSTLDPYTDYITESEIEDYRFITTGEYGGIGALIRRDSDNIVIDEPYEDSPAIKAGLMAGDRLVSIDGISIKGKSSDDVGKLLKGEAGTHVKIGIIPVANPVLTEKTLTREVIKVTNVPYYGMVTPSIGYIRLSDFTEDAGGNVKRALMALKKNTGIKGLIIDLRNNPGGLLNEAINVSSIFIPKGQLVVVTRGRQKEWNYSYYTTNDPVDSAIHIAVLVNSGSASASEIVTGTIQDLDRGIIIGTRTYGKGLVQQTKPLSYNAQMKFTVAKYYISSGRCIQVLDYSHRNEDGSVSKVPDSLKYAFRTKHGRVVYDGGGIDPDVKLEPIKHSVIRTNLLDKLYVFKFATDYRLHHLSIAPADSFALSDNDYLAFVNFAKNHNFTYTTKSDELLNDLKQSTLNEKYYDDLKDAYTKIKNDFDESKKNDFNRYKNDIKETVEEEIASRYYYEKGRIEVELQSDKEVTKAIEFLNNDTRYDSTLRTIAPAIRPFRNPALTNWSSPK
jgi:carboxyl-terminal processing protease